MKNSNLLFRLNFLAAGAMILIAVITSLICTGCQTTTKSLGGATTVTLEPGEKLEEITWKDDSLWYLTRPMRDDEHAETHHFKQSSNFGIIEGEVIVIEQE